ncbi:MAG: amino acid permease [bacterium]|nr:amino acid permease [bacterium]
MSNQPGEPSHPPRESLGVFDVLCIILGIIIGSAIYKTPQQIAAFTGSASLILLVWALGGVISLVGALCYAELASTYPRERGEYFYLRHAYGPWAGFLFAWARLAVIHTGNIAIMSSIAAEYAAQFIRFAGCETMYALAAVAGFTAINLLGLKQSRLTQNLLTTLKVIGLTAIVLAAFTLPMAPIEPAAPQPFSWGGFYLALIFVQFSFGGWSDSAFITAEMRDPGRNVIRALAVGVALVTAIYLGVNAALLWGLGVDGMAGSDAVAADLMGRAFGETGRRAVSALVIVSALGAVNGMTLTGGRLFQALGRDHRVFSALRHEWTDRSTPYAALIAQGVIAGALTLSGRFEDLVSYTMAAFWVFMILVGISLFISRAKDPDRPRPYRTHGYPFTPIAFIASSCLFLYSSLTYAGLYSGVGFGIVLSGLALYAAEKSMRS